MTDTSINDALRVIRRANGLTLSDLSNKIDLDASYLSRIENGRLKPNINVVKNYADTFKLQLSTIMLFAEEIQRKPTLKENLLKSIMRLMLIVEKRALFDKTILQEKG